MKMSKVAMMLTMGLSGFAVSAAEYYWDGSSAVWDTTTSSWLLDNQTPAVPFVSGNVMKVTQGSSTKVTFAQQVKPSEFVYDSSADMTMDIQTSGYTGRADKPFADTASFVKRGTGTLTIWKNNTTAGELGIPASTVVEVEAGALKFWTRNSPALGGVGNTVHVHSGAEFWTCNYSSFGNPYTKAAERLNIILGGTLKMNDNGSSYTATEHIRSLALEGGTIYGVNQGNADYGVLTVCDDIYVTNTTLGTTQTLTVDGNAANRKVTLNPVDPTTLHVDDVTGDATDDLIFDTAHADTANVSLFYGDKSELQHTVKKVGAGTMRLAANTTPFNIRVFDIQEGRFEFPRAQYCIPNTNFTVRVHTGATFCIPMRNTLSPGYSCGWLDEYQKPKYHILGGTFIIGDTAWSSEDGQKGNSYAGDELILSNATFVCNLGYRGTDATYGALMFGRLFALDGETPYTFPSYTDRGWAFQSTRYGGTELRVADITGDDGVDVTFDGKLRDNTESDAKGGTVTARPSGFTKTGPGTVKFTARYNNFTGDCEIREGTAIFQAASPGDSAGTVFGSTLVARRTTVKTGATLVDEDANYAYWGSALDGWSPAEDRFKSELMLDGGRLLLHNVKAAASGKGVCWLYASLAFKNGGYIEYDDSLGGNGYGQIAVTGVRVEAGDTAAVHEIPLNPKSDANQNLYLFQTNLVFDIADSSKDARADLTVALNPVVRLSSKFDEDSGFVKRGAGTLRFCGLATESYYGTAPRGTVSVEEGGLIVDAAHGFDSLAGGVCVAAGAAIGGTGAISGLTLAEGAAIEGTLRQSAPLAVAGSVTIPETGKMILTVPAGMTDEEIVNSSSVYVLSASGGLVGAQNLAAWTVEMPGHEHLASKFHLMGSGNRIRCSYRRGMTFFIR